jgi:3-isopropylmalate/(R)-2-methylmalate dehydratase large subunit
MRVKVDGALPPGVTAKDIILAIIGQIGTAGGTGHVIEYCGSAIESLSMEGRMTVCTCRLGLRARAGMTCQTRRRTPISRTGRSPKGALGTTPRGTGRRRAATRAALTLLQLDAANLPPIVLGHEPGTSRRFASCWLRTRRRVLKRASIQRALDYMGLKGGEKMTDLAIDRALTGSCTNGRIDLQPLRRSRTVIR